MLRNLVAGRILDMKTPQTRDGYARLGEVEAKRGPLREAAE
jgi:hypothetical protein